MPIFRCLMRGESFPFSVDGAWKTMGFYATRFVNAASADEAETAALNLLKEDSALIRDPNTPGLEHARIFFDEIEEVAAASAPNAGFVFFDEEES